MTQCSARLSFLRRMVRSGLPATSMSTTSARLREAA
uniref:Uncharacterized protein n=1 Tax=Arundo donax TaxID=35708 RepID=A0A0A9GJM4_ARUDO